MDIIKKLTAQSKEAAEFGFQWETAQQIMNQIRSETDEITEQLPNSNKQELQNEIGDLLHATFSLCIFLKLDINDTLQKSMNKFDLRFNQLKQLAKEQGLTTLHEQSFDDLMDFWEKAKNSTM